MFKKYRNHSNFKIDKENINTYLFLMDAKQIKDVVAELVLRSESLPVIKYLKVI